MRSVSEQKGEMVTAATSWRLCSLHSWLKTLESQWMSHGCSGQCVFQSKTAKILHASIEPHPHFFLALSSLIWTPSLGLVSPPRNIYFAPEHTDETRIRICFFSFSQCPGSTRRFADYSGKTVQALSAGPQNVRTTVRVLGMSGVGGWGGEEGDKTEEWHEGDKRRWRRAEDDFKHQSPARSHGL